MPETPSPADPSDRPAGAPAAADPWHPFDLAVARVALALDDVESVPAAAVVTDANGASSPSLSALAHLGDAPRSEIAPLIKAIYDDEREGGRPKGGRAARLVANDLIAAALAARITPADAIHQLFALWEAGGFPDGDLSDLAIYDEQLELAAEGALRSSHDDVLAEFLGDCRAVSARGGVQIDEWQPPVL